MKTFGLYLTFFVAGAVLASVSLNVARKCGRVADKATREALDAIALLLEGVLVAVLVSIGAYAAKGISALVSIGIGWIFGACAFPTIYNIWAKKQIRRRTP